MQKRSRAGLSASAAATTTTTTTLALGTHAFGASRSCAERGHRGRCEPPGVAPVANIDASRERRPAQAEAKLRRAMSLSRLRNAVTAETGSEKTKNLGRVAKSIVSCFREETAHWRREVRRYVRGALRPRAFVLPPRVEVAFPGRSTKPLPPLRRRGGWRARPTTKTVRARQIDARDLRAPRGARAPGGRGPGRRLLAAPRHKLRRHE